MVSTEGEDKIRRAEILFFPAMNHAKHYLRERAKNKHVSLCGS